MSNLWSSYPQSYKYVLQKLWILQAFFWVNRKTCMVLLNSVGKVYCRSSATITNLFSTFS